MPSITKGHVLKNIETSFDKDSYDKYIDDSCTSPLNYASAEDIQEVRNAIISEQEEYLLYEEYNKYDLAAKKNLHKPRVINSVSLRIEITSSKLSIKFTLL